MKINQYMPNSVIQGLIDGEDYVNRVAGSCVYHCPYCKHRIRFRWRNFFKADERSFLQPEYQSTFNHLIADSHDDENSFLDFHCPTCGAPTRINFTAIDYTELAYHFDIQSVFVGERLK